MMKRQKNNSFSRRCCDQRGQTFAGYLVVILALMALTITATRYYKSVSEADIYQRQYGELALQAAHAGFIKTHSWFINNTGPIASQGTLTVGENVAGKFPDKMFLINDASGNSALVETIAPPLIAELLTVTASTTFAARNIKLMYSVKRQILQNYPPDIYAANHDPLAVHDVSHTIKDGEIGKGLTWQITSRGFVYASQTAVTDTTAFEDNKIYNPPKLFWPTSGKRFRLGMAQVTGRILKAAFTGPAAAVWVNNGNDISNGTSCTIDGADGTAAIARGDTTPASGAGTVISACCGGSSYTQFGAPSYQSAFGQSLADIKKISSTIQGATIPEVIPAYDPFDPAYKEAISSQRFLVLDNGNPATTYTFDTLPPHPDPDFRVLSGNGIFIVNGNLVIKHGTGGLWTGVIFVNGDVTINRPYEISGTLVATGAVKLLGNPDQVTIGYSSGAIQAIDKFLLNYSIDRSSMRTLIY